MRIHHSRPDSDFAIIPNDTLRDERLSLAARGELVYLLSLPDGWNTTADLETKRARSLRGKRGEGRDAMRRIYAELKSAGYITYVRTQDNGKWSTEIHVFDSPRTDMRLTDTPETRTSVPPAKTPEPVDNSPDEFSQLAPMYGSPGVGPPAVGSPVHRSAVHSYEDGTREDEDQTRAGLPGAGQGAAPTPEDPIANSQKRRVHDGPDTRADDDQNFSLSVQLQSPATDRNARASGSGRPQSSRSPEEIAAQQVAESRARREAAERAGRDQASPVTLEAGAVTP